MQRRRPGNPNAPRLPLQRSVDALAPDGADDVNDEGEGEGMGKREDTTLIPLRRGEVRVPAIRPPVIMGRWASVTQTGELFPSEFAEPSIVSPSSYAHDDDGGAMEAMEKHVSNMLLDDEDPAAPALATPVSSNAPPGSQHHGVDGVPATVAVAPSTKTAARVGGALLKRISDHHPMFLFPPPPPPAANSDCFQYLHPDSTYTQRTATATAATHDTGGRRATHHQLGQLQVYSPLMRKKMMRWYQIVELWCIERAVDPADGATFVLVLDHERAIVAPPPRPPMFSEEVAPQLLQKQLDASAARPHAPYNVDRWASSCAVWWERVMESFDKLRNVSEFGGMHHVAKAHASKVWAAKDAAALIA